MYCEAMVGNAVGEMHVATTPHLQSRKLDGCELWPAAAAAGVTLSHELPPCRVRYGLQLPEYASCMCKESNDRPFQVHSQATCTNCPEMRVFPWPAPH